jgi:hypothetical protein
MARLFCLLRALLAHPISHRAIDETEADWRHEAAEAASARMRSLVHARALMAAMRLVVFSGAREVTVVPFLHLTLRVGLFLIPVVVLMQTPMGVFGYWRRLDWPWALSVTALLLPGMMVPALPVAVFYAIAGRTGRTTPILAVSLVAFVAAYLLQSWVAPAALEQLFRIGDSPEGSGVQLLAGIFFNGVPAGWRLAVIEEWQAQLLSVMQTVGLPLVVAAVVPFAHALNRRTWTVLLGRVAIAPAMAGALWFGHFVVIVLMGWITPASEGIMVVAGGLHLVVTTAAMLAIAVWLLSRSNSDTSPEPRAL